MKPEENLRGESRRASTSSVSSTAPNAFGAVRLHRLSLASRRRYSAVTNEEDTWGPLGLQILHSPSEALVDIIFVHGLRGGSIKTWCKGDDLQYFWPREWLSQEHDLRHARIHSFGYNADWADPKKTELDIHDFGRSLLGALLTSPPLRQERDVSLIQPPTNPKCSLLLDTDPSCRPLYGWTCDKKGTQLDPPPNSP